MVFLQRILCISFLVILKKSVAKARETRILPLRSSFRIMSWYPSKLQGWPKSFCFVWEGVFWIWLFLHVWCVSIQCSYYPYRCSSGSLFKLSPNYLNLKLNLVIFESFLDVWYNKMLPSLSCTFSALNLDSAISHSSLGCLKWKILFIHNGLGASDALVDRARKHISLDRARKYIYIF